MYQTNRKLDNSQPHEKYITGYEKYYISRNIVNENTLEVKKDKQDQCALQVPKNQVSFYHYPQKQIYKSTTNVQSKPEVPKKVQGSNLSNSHVYSSDVNCLKKTNEILKSSLSKNKNYYTDFIKQLQRDNQRLKQYENSYNNYQDEKTKLRSRISELEIELNYLTNNRTQGDSQAMELLKKRILQLNREKLDQVQKVSAHQTEIIKIRSALENEKQETIRVKSDSMKEDPQLTKLKGDYPKFLKLIDAKENRIQFLNEKILTLEQKLKEKTKPVEVMKYVTKPTVVPKLPITRVVRYEPKVTQYKKSIKHSHTQKDICPCLEHVMAKHHNICLSHNSDMQEQKQHVYMTTKPEPISRRILNEYERPRTLTKNSSVIIRRISKPAKRSTSSRNHQNQNEMIKIDHNDYTYEKVVYQPAQPHSLRKSSSRKVISLLNGKTKKLEQNGFHRQFRQYNPDMMISQ